MFTEIRKILTIASVAIALIGVDAMLFAKAPQKEKSAQKLSKKKSSQKKRSLKSKDKSKNRSKSKQAKRSPNDKSTKLSSNRNPGGDRISFLKRKHRSGELSSGGLWGELSEIDSSRLDRQSYFELLNTQSSLLLTSGYPMLSGLYAMEAIQKVERPYATETKGMWLALWQASQRRSMQNLLEDFAGQLKDAPINPPGFGNNWFYYVGNAAQARGDSNDALAQYDHLRINDYHYLSGKYQTAMIHLANDRRGPAEAALKTMLNSVSQTMASIPEASLKEESNYAKLALARLYYQSSDFKAAIKFYRAVDRDSRLFYDSLFEQSWAFFMAGYPNHALGSIHSVESPFFKDVYNPEASVLRAIVYYWMCRYEDSRGALADFTERHSDAVESLEGFLDRKRLSADDAYQLFENYVSGVSSESLGIPKTVLEVASTEDAMMLLRDQYAGMVSELDRLESAGVYGSKAIKKPTEVLRRQIKSFRNAIGNQFIAELQGLKKHFEMLYEQSQFLYVELLMSEKEQLLGRELHASTKIDRVSKKKNISGWGNKTLAWGDNRLNEFWWDEVGFYIYSVKPLCKGSQ